MKAVFWLGIMFFMQISCLRFKQSRISLLISHIYVLGCFGNYLVIFRYIWREIGFLKGLVKLMEIAEILKICCCFKIEFGIKKLVDTLQTVAQQPGVPLYGRATVWWVFHNPFFPFEPLFKLTKISLKFTCTPALSILRAKLGTLTFMKTVSFQA